MLKHCFEHYRQAAVRVATDSWFFPKHSRQNPLFPRCDHASLPRGRCKVQEASRVAAEGWRSRTPRYHGTVATASAVSIVFTNDVQRPARVEAGLARTALPAYSSASVDGVGRDGVRRPAAERCVSLTQVVRQLQHTHPLSSQKEKACRIVTNHHQIDSSPRRVRRFTSTRHVSQILKRTVFHQS